MENLLKINLSGSKTIKIKCNIYSPNKEKYRVATLIYDTGADKTAITEDMLVSLGYGDFKLSDTWKRVAVGEFKPLTSNLSEIIIGNQFRLRDMPIDVLEVEVHLVSTV